MSCPLCHVEHPPHRMCRPVDLVAAKPGGQPSPASAVSVVTPARASTGTKRKKARTSTPRKAVTATPIAAGSVQAGTSEVARRSDIAALLGNLSGQLPQSEAAKLSKFVSRLEREREANRAKQKRFRDRAKQKEAKA